MDCQQCQEIYVLIKRYIKENKDGVKNVLEILEDEGITVEEMKENGQQKDKVEVGRVRW